MKKLKILAATALLVISATLGFAACGGEKIATPTGFDIVNNRLTWEDVENARSYIIEIKNAESGEVKTSSSNRENITLSSLAVGDYEIRVKAVGANKKDVSAWSEVLYFEREYESGCVYKLVNNTEYQIYRVGSAAGEVKIEDFYREKPVTSIANKAFYKSSKINKIELGENIKTIGDNAFYNCVNLTAVIMPETITSIGVSAFQGCHRLTDINIPDAITTLNEYTFAYCRALKEIEIPSTVTALGNSVFYDCTSLEKIIVPDSVTSIGQHAFAESTALHTAVIGKGVELVDEFAFNKCTALKNLTFSAEGSLKTLGERAFAETEALKEVVLPDGLETVGFRAFSYCTALEAVTIPSTVTNMGAYAFSSTKLLVDQLNALNGKGLIYAGNWVIGYIDSQEDVLTTLDSNIIRENTVGIADRVFMGALKIASVKLPTTVKYVGNYAFYNCPSLWNVETLSTESLGDYSFAMSSNLSRLELGEGLLTIGSHAFEKCTRVYNSSLGNSIIPSTVTRIGTDAFKETGLWNETIPKPGQTVDEDFDGVVYAGNWVVGYTKATAYVDLRDDTVGISDYAFFDNGTLTDITGLKNVKNIGKGAFYECGKLSSINLSRSLKTIEDYTFYKCESLSSVSMPAKLISIGRSAFYKCTRLYSIDFSSGEVETIAPYAFYGCTALQEVLFSDTVTSVDEYAFYKCTALTEIVLPASMQTIGEKAYYKCENLRSIDLGGTVDVGNYSFYGCTKLQSVTLPDSVETVGKNAFYKCTEVKDIVFGAGLRTIGDYAFYGLEELRELTVPTGVEIGNYAFKGAERLTSVLLKNEVETLGAHAFYGIDGLTIYTDEKNSEEVEWNKRWNSSYRPVVWGCTLSEDASFVESVTIEENTLDNVMAKGGFSAPQRAGYVFVGWATSATAEEAEYTADKITEIPVGTTVYSLWDTFVPTITFIHNVEGCELLETTVEYGKTLTMEEDLTTTAQGYEFVGFYTDADMVLTFDFAKPITRDTEIYVKWENPNGEATNGDEDEE